MLRSFSRLALIVLFTCSCLLNAQEFRSTLAGRVVDQTGAVVVGAKVQAIEMGTNSRYETDTNSDGLYNFPLLLPGQYELRAEAKGFKTFSQQGIQVNANARVAQEIVLAVGSTSDSVTITS
ncbi:MAG: carboxypeptidase-like regulatory domain-containing protein, partial [Bryobacteraceae bacterium]